MILTIAWSSIKGVINSRGVLAKFGSAASLLFLIPFGIAGVAVPIFAIFSEALSPGIVMLVGTAIGLGILNVLFYNLLSAPTVSGRQVLDQLEGFRMYMKTAEEERLKILNPPEKTPELFERYLPYALALDCENEWNAKFTAVLAAAALAGAAAPSGIPAATGIPATWAASPKAWAPAWRQALPRPRRHRDQAQVPAVASQAAAVHRVVVAGVAEAAAGKPSLLPVLPSAFQVPATVPRPGYFRLGFLVARHGFFKGLGIPGKEFRVSQFRFKPGDFVMQGSHLGRQCFKRMLVLECQLAPGLRLCRLHR